MSVTQVQTTAITDNAIITNKIADSVVTSNKLEANSNAFR